MRRDTGKQGFDAVSCMQTYTCAELNALTRDVIAARRTSIAEAGQEIAELLKASHAMLEVQQDHIDENSCCSHDTQHMACRVIWGCCHLGS